MWVNVTLNELDQLFNQAGQCITSHCCFCNGEAGFLLTRTSEMSDRTYSDRVCLSCAKRWKPDDERVTEYERHAAQLKTEALSAIATTTEEASR